MSQNLTYHPLSESPYMPDADAIEVTAQHLGFIAPAILSLPMGDVTIRRSRIDHNVESDWMLVSAT